MPFHRTVARAALLGTLCSALLAGSAGAQPASDSLPPQSSPVEITVAEFAARRAALAERVKDGVVLAFGGRTLVHDFSTFYQLPAFRYLTNYNEPDGAFVMVVRGGKGESTLYLTPLDPRTAFYYGERADSTEQRGALRAARPRVRRAGRRPRLARAHADCRSSTFPTWRPPTSRASTRSRAARRR